MKFVRYTMWGILLCFLAGCAKEKKETASLEERIAQLEEVAKAAEARVSNIEEQLVAPAKTETEAAEFLRVIRTPLVENSTGNERCAALNKLCLAVNFEKSALLYDRNDRACGYAVADCNTRVVPLTHCLKGSDFVAAPIKFWRSPGMRGQCSQVGNQTCLYKPGDLIAMCINQ